MRFSKDLFGWEGIASQINKGETIYATCTNLTSASTTWRIVSDLVFQLTPAYSLD
jgi:hypothetical protein